MMNSSENYSDAFLNETNASFTHYSSLDYIFNSIGYTRLCDMLYMYLMTSVSIVGFILNILSLIILTDKDLPSIDLYKFLRVYVLNGVIVNFVYIFEFLSTSFRHISFAYSYPAQVYYNHILLPIVTTGYCYASILDIAITLDRIGNFNIRVKAWIKLGPYKICAIGFLATVLLNFADYLAYMPAPLLDPSTNNQIGWYCEVSEFGMSEAGSIILFIIYAVRDLLLLIIGIGLNFISVYFLSKHMKKKANLVRRGTQVEPNMTAYQPRMSMFEHCLRNLTITRKSTIRSRSRTISHTADRNLTIMAILLSLLSMCEHVTYLTAVIFPFSSEDLFAYNLIAFAGDFTVTFKQACNFLVFFAFNKCFRKLFFKLIKRSNFF
jgi:hypothetical protein